jgi:hypothetical protein
MATVKKRLLINTPGEVGNGQSSIYILWETYRRRQLVSERKRKKVENTVC